jgi:hypothetical protein
MGHGWQFEQGANQKLFVLLDIADHDDEHIVGLSGRRKAAHDVRCGGNGAFKLARLLRFFCCKDHPYAVCKVLKNIVFLHGREGDYRLRFHFAPPVLSALSNGTTPRKRSFGAWVLPLLRVLQHGKRVRGTVLDVFGHTAERRLERQLISDYETRVREVLAHLKADAANVDPHLVQQVLALPQQMRGFGHVKERHILAAQHTQAQLLHRLWPARYPAPLPQAPSTGSFKGIAIKVI